MRNNNDLESRVIEVLKYCKPYTDQMWAANVIGILLCCDFRDTKGELAKEFEYRNDMEYLIDAVMDSKLAVIRADELKKKYQGDK